jgi:hypothetical protein
MLKMYSNGVPHECCKDTWTQPIQLAATPSKTVTEAVDGEVALVGITWFSMNLCPDRYMFFQMMEEGSGPIRLLRWQSLFPSFRELR